MNPVTTTDTEPDRLDRIRAIILDAALQKIDTRFAELRARIDQGLSDTNDISSSLGQALQERIDEQVAAAYDMARVATDEIRSELGSITSDVKMAKEREAALLEEVRSMKASIAALEDRTDGLASKVWDEIRALSEADGAFMTSSDVHALFSEMMSRLKNRRW